MAADCPEAPTALVSIGIPTFNRAASLERGLRSALGQTHDELEIVISDNASTDKTPELCAALARSDERVRVIRRPENIGATANFNAVVEACRGEFILLLADDDWLAADYIERCLAELRARPELALACGRARYYRGDVLAHEGGDVRLSDPDPARRVAGYFRAVGENATFYGLMRADVARAVYPVSVAIGGDWLLMARVAAIGGLETLGTTTLSRSLGGASTSVAEFVGLPRVLAPHVHLVIGWHVMREIGWASPAYTSLGRTGRLALALRCELPLVRKWCNYLYARLLAPVLAHPLTRRVRPVTRLRELRARSGAARGRSTR